MFRGILIARNGEDTESINVNCTEDKLYKRCGFKTPNDFKLQQTWKLTSGENVLLYGKSVGKANTENQYDFPPPVSSLFFGKCLLMKRGADNAVQDFQLEEWDAIRDELVGGTETLGSEDTRSVDSESFPDEEYTSQGYHKGGVDGDFIAGSDEELEEEAY